MFGVPLILTSVVDLDRLLTLLGDKLGDIEGLKYLMVREHQAT
jgi:hypothetical protein